MRDLSHCPKPQWRDVEWHPSPAEGNRLPRPLPSRPDPTPTHASDLPCQPTNLSPPLVPHPCLVWPPPSLRCQSGLGARAPQPIFSLGALATAPCPTLPALSICHTRPVSGLLGPGENLLPFLTLGDCLRAVGTGTAGLVLTVILIRKLPVVSRPCGGLACRPLTCCGFSRSPARLEGTVWLWGFFRLTTCLTVLHWLQK